MDEQLIIKRGIQSIQADSGRKCEVVPLRHVIKEALIDLYCKGVLPKEVTQKLYNLLRLKKM
jgi:hypothetical protein